MNACSKIADKLLIPSVPSGQAFCYQSLVQAMGEGVVVIDSEARVVLWTAGVVEVFGYEAAETLGHSLLMLIPVADQSHYQVALQEFFKRFSQQGLAATKLPRRRLEVEAIRKDGVQIPVELTLGAWADQGRLFISAVVRDISVRKELESSVKREKEVAEQANQAKSDFLASMSHEIRTPMNGVLGLAELLEETALNHSQQRYVRAIRHSGKTLMRIINDVLDISKIQAGKVALELIPFDLCHVLNDLVEVFAERASRKGVLMTHDIPPHFCHELVGDVNRLSQILFNLLGNAIKFTQQGTVQLSASVEFERQEEVVLRFSIKDTGIGIPSAYRADIFTAFSQADASVSRRYGGTGLGLVITAKLAGLMGGKLDFESKEGEGTEFWFTASFQKMRQVTAQVSTPPGSKPLAEQENHQFTANILLAEDNPINQEVTLGVLTLLGCQTDLVEDGRRAVARFKRKPSDYDLVLMDCQMPVMDGYQASQEIRAWESRTQKRRTPIIALTAHVMGEAREVAVAAGMDDYLSKPFNRHELAHLLSRWLKPKTTIVTGATIKRMTGAPKHRPYYDNNVIDPTSIAQLRNLQQAGQPCVVSKMINLYLGQAPDIFATMQQAIVDRDASTLGRMAHSFKAGSATLGAGKLAQVCADLEGNAACFESAEVCLKEVKANFKVVQKALENVRQQAQVTVPSTRLPSRDH